MCTFILQDHRPGIGSQHVAQGAPETTEFRHGAGAAPGRSSHGPGWPSLWRRADDGAADARSPAGGRHDAPDAHEAGNGGRTAGASAIRQRTGRIRAPGSPAGAAASAGREEGPSGGEVWREGSQEPGPAGRWRDGQGSSGPERWRRARRRRQRCQARRQWGRAASAFGRGGPGEGAADHASAEVVGRADFNVARRSEGEYSRAQEAN